MLFPARQAPFRALDSRVMRFNAMFARMIKQRTKEDLLARMARVLNYVRLSVHMLLHYI